MPGLRIDRPCQVRKAAPGRWEWTCLCSPAVWPCTGRATNWADAQTAADEHLATDHPAAEQVVLATVIDLAAYRCAPMRPAGVLEFVRPGGGAA